jgi:peptidoglycan hydrolase-like protein with peptidoglycan-binding domain
VLFRRPTTSRLAVAALLALGVPALTVMSTPVAHASGTSTRSATMPRLGDRGESVRTLQRALIAAGIAVRGGADGIFGQSTQSALRTFQSAKGLVASGEIDPSTAFLLGLGPSPAFPKRGDRGAAVTTMQNALIAAGLSVRGGADGIFGAGTTTAVTSFQSARGLTATGVVDITTAIALGIAPASATNPANTAPASTAPVTTAPNTTAPVTSTPATTAPEPVLVVAAGQRGESVMRLQRALIAAGMTVRGGADGVFGAATTNAVTSYQRAVSIAATGQVDTLTAQFLGLVAAPTLPTFGDRGPAVTDLQNRLIAAGITVKGGADGVFGVATRVSLRAFQTARRIPVTGVVDLRTALQLGVVPGLVSSQPSSSSPSSTTPASTTPASTSPASTVPITTVSISVFPVLGPCWFSDTWMAPRAGGRRHEGVDIIARTGQPLYAVVDGTITRQFFDRPGSLGGNALRLTAADGTYFHYAHLSTFAEGIGLDSRVVAGQVIGYVGSTGSSSAPHLHFEYHPGGGAAVNPFPIVKAVDGCRSTTPPTTAPASTTVPASTTTPAP